MNFEWVIKRTSDKNPQKIQQNTDWMKKFNADFTICTRKKRQNAVQKPILFSNDDLQCG